MTNDNRVFFNKDKFIGKDYTVVGECETSLKLWLWKEIQKWLLVQLIES